MKKNKIVLLAEEDGYVVEIISRMLERFPGLELIHAADAASAFAALEERSPDIALLDIYMPGVSGLELLQKAREKNPKICAIMITGPSDDELGRKAVREGAWDFVSRPAELDRLQNLLELRLMINP
ncbi:MAG: response regulator [bacterium]